MNVFSKRSWRTALVVLTLCFALTLSSCNNSSSDTEPPDETTPTTDPVDQNQLENTEGTVVDIEQISIEDIEAKMQKLLAEQETTLKAQQQAETPLHHHK